MIYRKDIDGLRTVAVIGVLLFHLGIETFSGGFIGVDIFFVISGYLISSIIYDNLKNDSFSLYNFYSKRIRRILPAAYLIFFVTSVFCTLYFMPKQYAYFLRSVLSSILFFSNIQFWNESGYFDLNSEMKPLLHTWSLSLEEQFYIFFPIIFYFLFKYFKKNLLGLIFIFFSISLAYDSATVHTDSSSAFYFTHLRAWELLLGTLIAIDTFPKISSLLYKNIFSLIGLILMIVPIFTYSKSTYFPGVNALIPCIGTAFIIASNINQSASSSWVQKLLELKFFTFTGKISYSLYLWHWPIIVFYKYYYSYNLNFIDYLYIVLLSYALSYLTWKFVENPFRKIEQPLKHKPFMTALCFSSLFLCSFSIYGGYINKGISKRLSQKVLNYAKATSDGNPDRKQCHTMDIDQIKNGHLCNLGQEKEKIDFLIWGDSYADASMPVFKKSAQKHELFGKFASYSACLPLLNTYKKSRVHSAGCTEFNDAILEYIDQHNIKLVVMIGTWHYDTLVKNKDENKIHGLKALKYGFNLTFKKLHRMQVKTLIVGPIPEPDFDVPATLGKYELLHQDKSTLHINYEKFLNRKNDFDKTLSKFEDFNFSTIDYSKELCEVNKNICYIEKNNTPLYRDSHHLSSYGVLQMGEIVETALLKELNL